MRVLVICDDIWHPAEVIERGLRCLTVPGVQFDIVKTAKDILTEKMIAEYPVLMICKGDCINAANSNPWFEEDVTEVGPRELRSYVETGGHLLIIHAGCDVNPAWLPQEEKFTVPCLDYINLIGCHFLSHPPRCSVTVHVKDTNHPLTNGVHDFTQRDEQYAVELTASDIHILLETETEEAGVQIGGYLRELGKGSIVLYTSGHTLSVWEDSNFQKLLCNAFLFFDIE